MDRCQPARLPGLGHINFASNYLNAGMVATRNGTAHPSVVPYQVFESRDGHVILGVTTDYQFAKFCECAGTSQWVTDDRFATTRARVENRAILVPLVAEVMATRDTADIAPDRQLVLCSASMQARQGCTEGGVGPQA